MSASQWRTINFILAFAIASILLGIILAKPFKDDNQTRTKVSIDFIASGNQMMTADEKLNCSRPRHIYEGGKLFIFCYTAGEIKLVKTGNRQQYLNVSGLTKIDLDPDGEECVNMGCYRFQVTGVHKTPRGKLATFVVKARGSHKNSSGTQVHWKVKRKYGIPVLRDCKSCFGGK